MIIYKITNNINGKIYVGQFSSKIKIFTKYLGSGKYIKCAIKKYGKEKFTKEILCECKTKEELNEKEIYWIKTLNSLAPVGYNLTIGGDGVVGGISLKKNKTYIEMYGLKKSNEIKQKMSLKKKNYIPWNKGKIGCFTDKTIQKRKQTYKQNMTDEVRKRISDGVKRGMTKEVRQHLSNVLKGKKLSPVTIEKLRQCNLGKHRSIETKLKISNTLTGRKVSNKTKQKISKKLKNRQSNFTGKKHSDKTKEKMRIAAKNRQPMTEETKQKISFKNKGRIFTLEHKLKLSQSKLNKRKNHA